MRLLLDTHAFLWWLNDGPELGRQARHHIQDPDAFVFVSAATAWEIAVKRSSGKLEAAGDIETWIRDNQFRGLDVTVAHAIRSAELPRHHQDPFDRLLVAQAQLDELTLVTSDEQLSAYDVEILAAAV